jgi:hypothetical protein
MDFGRPVREAKLLEIQGTFGMAPRLVARFIGCIDLPRPDRRKRRRVRRMQRNERMRLGRCPDRCDVDRSSAPAQRSGRATD